MIILCVPWVALGPKSVYRDSGLIFNYEYLTLMHQKYGVKSLIYLPPDYIEEFEKGNNPEESGVYPIYNTLQRNRRRQQDCAIDDFTANRYLTGEVCPIDAIYTNRQWVVPHMMVQAEDFYNLAPIPVIFQPTCAGLDGHEKAVVKSREMEMKSEAMAYLSATRIFWLTDLEVKKGMAIARAYLSPAETLAVRKKHVVVPGLIYDGLRKTKMSDKEVCKRLQSKKGKDFVVSYIGRMGSNKNTNDILDTMKPLFVRHNIQIEVICSGPIIMPEGYKKYADKNDAKNVMTEHRFSHERPREYYAGVVLPNIHCMIYASQTEAFCATPREAIYVGAPVLLPDRPWARTAFDPKVYPFFYRDEAECMAIVKRIKSGDITDDEAKRFNECRKTVQLTGDTIETVYQVFKEETESRSKLYRTRRSHSKVLEAFQNSVKVGDEFTWSWLDNEMRKRHKLSIGEGFKGHTTTSLLALYRFFHPMLECLDPRDGIFKRIS